VSCLHALSFSKYNVIVKCKDPTGWWLKGPFAEASLGAVLVVASLSGSPGAAQTATVSVVPDADSFVRSLAPTNNYGGAGAISVSGSAAVNGSGQQNGLFDSLLRFPMSNLVVSLDGTFGNHDWIITRATLRLVEMGAPPNTLFNRGVGAFEIRWIGWDSWVEGTGTPGSATTDGVSYGTLPSMLNSSIDVSLGQFTNSGLDGPVSFNLGLAPSFLADIRSGGKVSLYLTAASAQVGFTADSRSFGTASARPSLEITAVPRPGPQVLSILALVTNGVAVSFDTVSNWTYIVQCADGFTSTGMMGWSNLITVTAQATNGHTMFADGVTNRRRFYRLVLAP
jgi:hypothetical protein